MVCYSFTGLSPDLQSMEQIRRIMRPTDVPETGKYFNKMLLKRAPRVTKLLKSTEGQTEIALTRSASSFQGIIM